MIGDLLEPGDIQPLLRELARRVSANRARVGIRVVGGAAIALLNADRRVTQDIDVLIHPAGSVQDVVDEMAAEHGLRPDWLNDAVKAKTPFVGDDDWVELLREGDVSVFIASTPLLLAMKMSANRGVRDTDDIHSCSRPAVSSRWSRPRRSMSGTTIRKSCLPALRRGSRRGSRCVVPLHDLRRSRRQDRRRTQGIPQERGRFRG